MLTLSRQYNRRYPILLLISTIIIRSIKSATVMSSTYIPGTNKDYSPPSDDYILDKVIVIHRHGDRAQISRSIGPSYPEHDSIKKIWHDRLPNEETLSKMYNVAITASSETKQFDDDIKMQLYSGFDESNYPYAQLTQLGSEQLTAIGTHLRTRYVDSGILPDIKLDNAASIYCRSTNICRTLQSLRSLLIGLFAYDNNKIPRDKLPIINTVPKLKEVLFPQADGPCKPMQERRQELLAATPMSTVPGYDQLEERMKKLLGYDEKVNWLTVKEILTCHAVHDIDHIKGVTPEDEEAVTKLTGWLWGLLYNDDVLNKLAIGRFLNELLLKLDDSNSGNDEKMLFFSGHDSTLVPVLCALGIFDNVWPPYASFLTIEIAVSKSTNTRFVKATYNDKDAIMTKIENNNSLWCPYENFIARLKSMSVTYEQYQQICDIASCDNEANKNEEDSDVKATIA